MRRSISVYIVTAVTAALTVQPGFADESVAADESPRPALTIAPRSPLAFPHASPTVLDHMPPALRDELLEIYRIAVDGSVAAAEAEAAWTPVGSNSSMRLPAAPANLRAADKSAKRLR